MKGRRRSRRGLLVLAVSGVVLVALAPIAMGGDEPWTTRPLSDASYVVPDDRIPSTRWLSDSTFLPEGEDSRIPSMRWVTDADFVPEPERVALNRVLSDSSYYPRAAHPVSSGEDASPVVRADPNTLQLIVGLLAVMAGAAGLIVFFARPVHLHGSAKDRVTRSCERLHVPQRRSTRRTGGSLGRAAQGGGRG